jgi:hypothetical protein
MKQLVWAACTAVFFCLFYHCPVRADVFFKENYIDLASKRATCSVIRIVPKDPEAIGTLKLLGYRFTEKDKIALLGEHIIDSPRGLLVKFDWAGVAGTTRYRIYCGRVDPTDATHKVEELISCEDALTIVPLHMNKFCLSSDVSKVIYKPLNLSTSLTGYILTGVGVGLAIAGTAYAVKKAREQSHSYTVGRHTKAEQDIANRTTLVQELGTKDPEEINPRHLADRQAALINTIKKEMKLVQDNEQLSPQEKNHLLGKLTNRLNTADPEGNIQKRVSEEEKYRLQVLAASHKKHGTPLPPKLEANMRAAGLLPENSSVPHSEGASLSGVAEGE